MVQWRVDLLTPLTHQFLLPPHNTLFTFYNLQIQQTEQRGFTETNTFIQMVNPPIPLAYLK